MEKKAYIKYVVSLLLFGTNGIVASMIALNSYEIVFWRALLGSLFLIGMFLILRGRLSIREQGKDFFYIIVSGVAMGSAWMCLYEAFNHIGVSLATLLFAGGPILVMALSPLIFGERLTGIKIAGLISVVSGMVLISGTGAMDNGISSGVLLGIASAVFTALMIIFNKLATGIQGLENPMIQLTTAFVVVAAFTLGKQGTVPMFSMEDLLPILFVGIINSGIGCYLYFSAIGNLAASTVAIVAYLEPLSALLLSALILHERLSHLQWIGAVLILGGAMLSEWFHSRAMASRIREPVRSEGSTR